MRTYKVRISCSTKKNNLYNHALELEICDVIGEATVRCILLCTIAMEGKDALKIVNQEIDKEFV